MTTINFDRAVDYYDQTRGFPPGVDKEVVAFISNSAGFTLQTRLLEIGVGTGRIALPLAAHVGHITGIDVSTAMMGRLLAKRTTQRVDVARADARRLPLKTASVDAAIAVHVFHLIEDADQVIDGLSRVIKPGGLMLHCSNHYDNSPLSVLNEAWEATDPAFARNVRNRWQDVTALFVQRGWQPAGEELHHPFVIDSTPQQFLDRIEQRQYSNTWRMSDAVIAEGVQAIKAAIDEHFDGDAQTPVRINASFRLMIFHRP